MTRFEAGERFVELSREGTTIHRRWGVTGRNEFTREEMHADANLAMVAWNQQLRRLEHRGYRPGTRNAALEEVLQRRPDDVDAYLVYADWLQERNDPRGTLISLMAAGADHASILSSFEEQLVPRITAEHYDWRLGFVWRAVLVSPSWSHVRRLLRHPSTLVLRRLVLKQHRLVWGNEVASWNTLEPLFPPTIVAIEVDTDSPLWRHRDALTPAVRRLLIADAG